MKHRSDIIGFIVREDRALLRSNPSARAMPRDGQGHMDSHMPCLSCSSFGSKAINLLSWGEAPSRAELGKYVVPVGHMSLFSGLDEVEFCLLCCRGGWIMD